MKTIKILFVMCMSLSLWACATAESKKRQVLDTGTEGAKRPEWVSSTRNAWDERDKTNFKSQASVKGNERLDACFDISRLNAKEAILTEASESIRGRLDEARQAISEDAETILQKSRSTEFSGKVSGIRFIETYYERYLVNNQERIDCFTLAQLSQADFIKIKQGLLSDIFRVDPKLKEAVTQKQIDFFNVREPASREPVSKEQ